MFQNRTDIVVTNAPVNAPIISTSIFCSMSRFFFLVALRYVLPLRVHLVEQVRDYVFTKLCDFYKKLTR